MRAPHYHIPSCANTRRRGLRGLAVVEFEQAAEPRTARDQACADLRGHGRDELVAQTLVRPLLVIVLDKRSYGRSVLRRVVRFAPGTRTWRTQQTARRR